MDKSAAFAGICALLAVFLLVVAVYIVVMSYTVISTFSEIVMLFVILVGSAVGIS